MRGARRNEIKNYFRKMVNDYVWSPGLAIPSERQLAKDLDLNRITLRRALAELQEEGFLVRQGRKLILTGLRSDISAIARMPDSRSITVIATWLADRFEYDIIRGIEAEANRQGFRVVLSVTKGLADGCLEAIETMSRQQTAGFIFFPINTYDHDQTNLALVQAIKSTGRPCVVIENHISEAAVDTVTSDHFSAAYNAVNHLLELGHKRIAFVSSRSCYTVERRILGYTKCLEDHGINPDTCPVFRYDSMIHSQQTTDAVDAILKSDPKITAIVSIIDAAALKIAKCLADKGIKVPEDIALTGFDDTSGPGQVEQFLTTSEIPLMQEGEIASQFLIDRINGYDGPPRFQVLPTKLILGRSTASQM